MSVTLHQNLSPIIESVVLPDERLLQAGSIRAMRQRGWGLRSAWTQGLASLRGTMRASLRGTRLGSG